MMIIRSPYKRKILVHNMHIKEIPKDINCVKLYHTCNVDPRGYRTFQNAVGLHQPGFHNYKIFIQ